MPRSRNNDKLRNGVGVPWRLGRRGHGGTLKKYPRQVEAKKGWTCPFTTDRAHYYSRNTYIVVQISDRSPVFETFISEIKPTNAIVYTYTITSLTECHIRT